MYGELQLPGEEAQKHQAWQTTHSPAIQVLGRCRPYREQQSQLQWRHPIGNLQSKRCKPGTTISKQDTHLETKEVGLQLQRSSQSLCGLHNEESRCGLFVLRSVRGHLADSAKRSMFATEQVTLGRC